MLFYCNNVSKNWNDLDQHNQIVSFPSSDFTRCSSYKTIPLPLQII